MLAAGRSAAAADTGAKTSNGTAHTALSQSDAEASAIAELQAFRPPADPWQVRYWKQIIAGVAVAATVGLAALGAYVWRSMGPSRLDEVKVEAPEQRSVLQQEATPAPLPAAPAPGGASRSVITHTASPSRQQPSTKVQDPPPVNQAECSEAVAALNLCASTPSNKAAQ